MARARAVRQGDRYGGARPHSTSADHQLKSGATMVVPVGLPDAQKLVVVDKDANGRIKTKEIMQVLFSLLEGPDEPAFRAS
jgi:protein-L-isoaspartate O-methyltransferase